MKFGNVGGGTVNFWCPKAMVLVKLLFHEVTRFLDKMPFSCIDIHNYRAMVCNLVEAHVAMSWINKGVIEQSMYCSISLKM